MRDGRQADEKLAAGEKRRIFLCGWDCTAVGDSAEEFWFE
jgi:hypothetical protein